ncbi:S41 family peptidase [Bacillus tianshenii]|nr:S41 family peptidase [Bacillus tianshenii]
MLFQAFVLFLFMFGTASAADIDEIRSLIEENYVDEVSESVIDQTEIDTILQGLDPYSTYFTQEEYEQFQSSINRNYTGIGVVVSEAEEGIALVSLFDESPAKAAGLQSGDIIIEADGHSLKGKPAEKATMLIQGLPGTKVNLKVYRPSSEKTFDVQVNRAEIHMPVVEVEKLSGNIGYIALYSFSENAPDKMKEAIQSLQGVDGWIVDLRDNGGGYLKSAQKVAGFFPGVKNSLIVESRDRQQLTYPSEAQTIQLSKPVALLINQSSASASEIVAGAVQDYGAATLYGQTTYGKGLAQTLFNVESGGMLKLSVARFYTPEGNVIHEKGIQPDVKTTEEQTLFAAHQALLLATEGDVVQQDSAKRPRYPVFTLQVKNPYDVAKLMEQIKLNELGGDQVPLHVHPVSFTTFKISPQQALKSNGSYLLTIGSGETKRVLSFTTVKELGRRDLSYVPFNDLKLSNYFTGPVAVLKNQGVVNGLGDGRYGPYHYLTRQDAAVMFARALNLDTENVSNPGFDDVKKGSYYYGAVAAMKETGIIKGRSEDRFGTNEILTREEMAALIARAFHFEKSGTDAPFLDVAQSQFKDDIVTIYRLGITTGSSPTTFSPNKVVTRGQFATFLYRAMVIDKGSAPFEIKEVN